LGEPFRWACSTGGLTARFEEWDRSSDAYVDWNPVTDQCWAKWGFGYRTVTVCQATGYPSGVDFDESTICEMKWTLTEPMKVVERYRENVITGERHQLPLLKK